LDFGFDFFGLFMVFGGDYKDLAAGCAAGAFSAVLAVEGNQGVAVGTVEPDCHF
jgi:hypothetical protein